MMIDSGKRPARAFPWGIVKCRSEVLVRVDYLIF